jgi:hypothetical protein
MTGTEPGHDAEKMRITKILPYSTISATAFRTPEASENLIHAAWQHCRRIAAA